MDFILILQPSIGNKEIEYATDAGVFSFYGNKIIASGKGGNDNH